MTELITIHPDLTTDDLERHRRTTLKKLGKVSADLEELLGKQNHNLSTMARADSDALKIMKLRQFKELLNETLRSIADGSYGLCPKCKGPIPVTELSEMPWTDRCAACPSA